LGIGFKLIENYMRDHAHVTAADRFRSILSWGSYEAPPGSGNVHYRLAEFLGGANHATVVGNLIAVVAFVLLGWSAYHFARKPLGGEKK
jgi:hypothetical protein